MNAFPKANASALASALLFVIVSACSSSSDTTSRPGTDGGSDTGIDTGVDTGSDAASDAANDTESDAFSDAVSDVTNDGNDGGPTARPRPPGPAADLSEELTGGNGPFIGAATGLAVPTGYVENEYVAAGTATDYKVNGTLTDDGLWTFEPDTSAAYRTRILVRRPANVADWSRTVIVEWLNVSGGVDANPDYSSLEEEIVRQGHAWVGVSAQLIGVSGGPVLVVAPGTESVAGKGLKTIDPTRYGTLDHPGDGYSFDIFTQVTRALLQGGAPLGGEKPLFMIAAGESQSALALTTYYDGVQPLTRAFDGFFVHSRAAVALPLVAPGAYADLVAALGTAGHPIFRDDLDAPVMDVQAESDVTGILDSYVVRQPETGRFRLQEIAGTSHADAHLLGSIASALNCGVSINNGPMHLVAKAALHDLVDWTEKGTLPPTAPRLDVPDDAAQDVTRDGDGIATSGIRTPPVDVPVDVLSGVPGPGTDLICLLLGSTTPLTGTRLAALYTNRADYQAKYDADVDATILAGWVLEPDRAALEAFAQPLRISP